MILLGGDSATPKPAQYFPRKVWGVYVAGATFRVWTRQEVRELARYRVQGVMPIVVPPQDHAWWELNSGYAAMEQLVREAKAWGVPAGAPLCLDIEQHQADQMPAKSDVAHAWAVATRSHGYRTWTYSGLSYLLADHYGFRWVADWNNDPRIPQGFNAHQWASDDTRGIDHDSFESGRDYMTPNLGVAVLNSDPAASSRLADSAEEMPAPGSAAPAAEAGVGPTDTARHPTPANSKESP